MKKIIALAGQTGTGKTELAYNLARKLNGEIIVVDSIQQYKELNIIANKPPKLYQEGINYHNIDIISFPNEGLKGAEFAKQTREKIKLIWSKNKTPILEGGCGFYYKMIFTGASLHLLPEQEEQYEIKRKIAKEIISYDADHNKTMERLLKFDESLPIDAFNFNDVYRLEKRLTDALFWGNGAFKIIKEKEEKIRQENVELFKDCDIHKFFLYLEKSNLIKKLEKRCEEMLRNGIIQEVENLLLKNLITPDNYIFSKNVIKNAIGVKQTIDLLSELVPLIPNKAGILLSLKNRISKKDTNYKFKKKIEKIFYDYLFDFTVVNHQYAKTQAKWFKSNENEEFLWIKPEEIVDESNFIEKFLNFGKSENAGYKNKETPNKEILTNDNEEKIKKYFEYKHNLNYKSEFEIFKDPKKLADIIEKAFNTATRIKDILLGIKNAEKNSDTNLSKGPMEEIKKYLI